MELLKKVATSPNACQISLFFSGQPSPSSLSSTDIFFASELSADHEADVYVSSGSVKVREASKQTRAGLQYHQTVTFALPTNDGLRAQRIEQFKRVRFLAIKLSDDRQLFFGRNDASQNTKPKIEIISDEKLTQIQYKQISIAPLSFLINEVFTFQDGIQFLFQDGVSFNVS